MATKKFLEVSAHSDDNLASELKSAEREYQQIRFDHYTRGLDNVGRIRELRRDIARLKTETTRRSLAQINDGAGRAPKLTRRKRLQGKQA